MAAVMGFIPWIAYWALLGNTPFRTAVLVAFGLTVGVVLIGVRRSHQLHTLEAGNVVVFAVLTLAAFTLDDRTLERWMQPLSNLGLTLVVLGGLLLGRPFVTEYAKASVDEETARTDGFRYITTRMTWMWCATFAAMTVISAIPPIVEGEASIRDEDSVLSILCYWVFPYVLLGLAGLVSGFFPPWFEKRSAMVDERSASELAPAAQPAAPADVPTSGSLELTVDPVDALLDEAISVRVRGASGDVAVTTEGTDLYGRHWRATASFAAGSERTLDVGAATPTSGDWTQADPSALTWAMGFDEPDQTADVFVPPADPMVLTVTARSGDDSVRRSVSLRTKSDDTMFVDVDEHEVRGVLALPPTGSVRGPGVVCFGGSEGGFESQLSNIGLIAARGHPALAAQWFAGDEHGEQIAKVPVERFLDAIRSLAARPETGGDVVPMAISRGAEGLLAALAAQPDVTVAGVVLVSPSSVRWQALGGSGEIPDTGSWTYAGQELAWQHLPTGALMPELIHNAWRVGHDAKANRPTLMHLDVVYRAGLADVAVSAEIEAERVDAPLLVVTGDDDQVWPSSVMADHILSRRSNAGLPAARRDHHVAVAGAGHLTRLGNLPTDAPWTSGVAMGGTRQGVAAAQRVLGEQLFAFLGSESRIDA